MKIAAIVIVVVVGIFAVIYFSGDGESNSFEQSDSLSEQYTSLEHRPDYDLENIERLLVEYTNKNRIENGVEPLEVDEELIAIARAHSQDMAENNFFSHVNLDGLSANDRAINAGYECEKEHEGMIFFGISENIGLRSLSKSYIVEDGKELHNWHTDEKLFAELSINAVMDSPEHKDNMLKPYKDRVGIGVAINNENKLYQTQNFC